MKYKRRDDKFIELFVLLLFMRGRKKRALIHSLHTKQAIEKKKGQTKRKHVFLKKVKLRYK